MALKKILVTGAQGKEGRAIVRDLSAYGNEVVSVDLVRSVDGLPGSRPYIIAAKDTVMNRPNSELVAEVFPGVAIKRDLGEFETLLRIDRARAEFGFEPEWSWR